jgi:hypothetical protein
MEEIKQHEWLKGPSASEEEIKTNYKNLKNQVEAKRQVLKLEKQAQKLYVTGRIYRGAQ